MLKLYRLDGPIEKIRHAVRSRMPMLDLAGGIHVVQGRLGLILWSSISVL